MIWLIVLAVLLLLACWPFLSEARKPPLTADIRGTGTWAALSQGRTWYRWTGPSRGPVVVAIHGLTTPSPVFDDLAGHLAQSGYRVLCYDLYGRGLSDAVAGTQDGAFFLRQLDDLLRDQDVTGPVTLVGYSMGGTIATLFAARNAARVERIVLLASAGMGLNLTPFWRFARDTPVIGDWLARGFGAGDLRQVAATGTAIGRVQHDQLMRRGYLPAVLSSLRGALSAQMQDAHRAVAAAEIPVLAIWGGMDSTIPTAAMGQLAQWNRKVVHEVVPDATHALPWQHADVVAELMRDWMDGQAVASSETAAGTKSGDPTQV
ncbi:alpha/beta hydrolase [Loktanella sp. TSTF-M6]|uniref:Alpha/beta hydrolase n=1 Tax=Loktanella gaetbuli TaxID=2881335 RepID=A0ABS8BSY4_9RHOB|nr:alpha/beta hydrolase [Loktanella gaetbuli]MCB5198845.1 alpha/beta hydrolase [Loktanella gaetbuli]